MHRAGLLCLAGLAAVASPRLLRAYTWEYRIVERVGSVDYPLVGNTITVGTHTSHRYRIQFRVVANGDTDAPAGFIGYNVGTITTTGGINSRSAAPPDPNPRGRLAPFNFVPFPNSDGFPRTDPFTSLDAIDAIVPFFQTYLWGCDENGQPEPQPEGVAYGRNQWISVFEITSVTGTADYSITFGGNAVIGTSWLLDLCPPPECGIADDPSDDEPSECLVRYATSTGNAFSVTLNINVCAGEWNNDRVLNTADFFDYLTAFFGGNADVNNDGQTNTADYFDFMLGFVLGCR